jgi:hypothetical protein
VYMSAGRGTSLLGPVHADGSKFGDFAAAVVNMSSNRPGALDVVVGASLARLEEDEDVAGISATRTTRTQSSDCRCSRC